MGPAAGNAAPQEQREPPAQEPPPVPPSQPPPPCLPTGWKAVWNEEQSAFYYWHVPTSHVTWEIPGATEERRPQQPGGGAGADGNIAEVQQQNMVVEAAQLTGA